MNALDELIKRQKELEARADVFIPDGTLAEKAAAELAALRARVKELERHIQKLLAFSLSCKEDDPWIYEKNYGEEIIPPASAALDTRNQL